MIWTLLAGELFDPFKLVTTEKEGWSNLNEDPTQVKAWVGSFTY